MNVVLKPPVPRILPVGKAGMTMAGGRNPRRAGGEDPLAALLSKVPISTLQGSDHDVRALEISSQSAVGAAIGALLSKGATLAVIFDPENWEGEASSLRPLSSEGHYVGLVHLSWLILWTMEQADREARAKASEDQSEVCAVSLAALPADAGAAEGMIDLPLLLTKKWAGEGTERRPEPSVDQASAGDSQDSFQDFKKTMSSFAFFQVKGLLESQMRLWSATVTAESPPLVVQVASLARTRYWQPFLPLFPMSSLMDAISLTAQHRASVIPVLSPPSSNTVQTEGRSSLASSPVLQSYLTPRTLLRILSRFSGLQWFDQLLGQRTLSNLVRAGVGSQVQGGGVAAGTPLEAGLLQLCRTGQEAMPVVEQAEGRIRIVGQITEQDAVRMVTNSGLFRRRRQITMADYLQALGQGVRRCDEVVGGSAGPSERSLDDALAEVWTSTAPDQADMQNDTEEQGALVCSGRTTVDSALKAMVRGRAECVYVAGESEERPRSCTNGKEGDLNEPSLHIEGEGTGDGRKGANDEGTSSSTKAVEGTIDKLRMIDGKNIISLLTPKSALDLKKRWGVFFESVMFLSADIGRTSRTSSSNVAFEKG